MAYTRSGLKRLAGQIYEPEAIRVWSYSSTDAMSTVRAANYFADAKLRGMLPGDIVFVKQMTSTTVTAVTMAVVLTVGSSGADLSDGTTISVTNT